jgi:hypothetical protein
LIAKNTLEFGIPSGLTKLVFASLARRKFYLQTIVNGLHVGEVCQSSFTLHLRQAGLLSGRSSI